MQVQRLAAGQRVEASEQQVTKLRGDLDVVRDNVRLFSNLLEHVDPSGQPAHPKKKRVTTCSSALLSFIIRIFLPL